MAMLQERMNRLFEESLARSRTTEGEFPVGAWMPPVDVYETEDRIVIRIDLPGVDQNSIDLRIEDGALVVRGERTFASGENREDFLRIERSYGTFQRSFRLPATVDHGGVQASHLNGVLEVVLRKRESSKPQSIRIDVR
jgi:HSP20 family protein